MPSALLQKIKRGLKKPPHILAKRIWQEVRVYADRALLPDQVKRFGLSQLLKSVAHDDLNSLWQTLGVNSYCTSFDQANTSTAIELAAQRALSHTVDILGSGEITLGEMIDWHCDYKTGKRWENAYFKSIEYNNPELPSDVKFPWELSRLQWLIPVGQAYCASKDEKYAEFAKTTLIDWMNNNPVGGSVNWSCTMEAAMRIFTWTWFFHVFKNSAAWQDSKFQSQFLIVLYWHGVFTERYIEQSDINGNHFTADAAALVVAGLFWSTGKSAKRWHTKGWQHLETEILLQVSDDGVDFEGSTAYHRLVAELFFIAAHYHQVCGHSVSINYKNRLIKMAEFTQSYSRIDGSIPHVGDADDARVLPFGQQDINDHLYLPCLIGVLFDAQHLLDMSLSCVDEMSWWFGPQKTSANPAYLKSSFDQFSSGGYYCMRHEDSHIFIDGAPVGQGGRGGHGHNDCLSFTATLCNCELIVDRGAYVYTANYAARNEFRATTSHNTPQVDGEEINRFIAPDHLWTLHNDAIPENKIVKQNDNEWHWRGTHSGYARLTNPVQPVRDIIYRPLTKNLQIIDQLHGDGEHTVSIPLYLSADVEVVRESNTCRLHKNGKVFSLDWEKKDLWNFSIEPTTISRSYGFLDDSKKLVWRYQGKLPMELKVELSFLSDVDEEDGNV